MKLSALRSNMTHRADFTAQAVYDQLAGQVKKKFHYGKSGIQLAETFAEPGLHLDFDQKCNFDFENKDKVECELNTKIDNQRPPVKKSANPSCVNTSSQPEARISCIHCYNGDSQATKVRIWTHLEELLLVGVVFDRLFTKGSIGDWETLRIKFQSTLELQYKGKTFCRCINKQRTEIALKRHYKVMKSKKCNNFRSLYSQYEEILRRNCSENGQDAKKRSRSCSNIGAQDDLESFLSCEDEYYSDADSIYSSLSEPKRQRTNVDSFIFF
mmetsp:Transcript_24867/g.30421  ORF Transcript_24867/g.30421 Transcript_24867/m.30421 type:complete len:270 (+) Transcript_24867:150-959(+)